MFGMGRAIHSNRNIWVKNVQTRRWKTNHLNTFWIVCTWENIINKTILLWSMTKLYTLRQLTNLTYFKLAMIWWNFLVRQAYQFKQNTLHLINQYNRRILKIFIIITRLTNIKLNFTKGLHSLWTNLTWKIN